MRQKIVWFLLGVLIGSMFVVSAYPTGHQNPRGHAIFSVLAGKSSSRYSISGPFNWTPRPISSKLPVEIFKLARSEYPAFNNVTYIVTLMISKANYSIFEDGNNVVYYIEWRSGNLLKVGKVELKLVENRSSSSSRDMGSVLGHKLRAIIETHVTKWRVNAPEKLKSLYIVTASETYTWYTTSPITGKEFPWSKTTAKGKFYVDYGNAVVGIRDMSFEWHDTGVTVCSFNHGEEGSGTVTGEVYADAKYLVPTLPFGIHFDAHPRVYVDAWTNVDTNAWGNKNIGRPWCS